MTATLIVAVILTAVAACAWLLAVLRPELFAAHPGRHTPQAVARRHREENPAPTYQQLLRARVLAVQDRVALAAPAPRGRIA